MSPFKLKKNQAALILDVSANGDVTVEAAFPDHPDDAGDLAAALCTVIGRKLAEDESFQAQIMKSLENKDP